MIRRPPVLRLFPNATCYRSDKLDLFAVEEVLERLRQVEPAAATTAWLDAVTALKASDNLFGQDPVRSDALMTRVIESFQAAELRDPSVIAYPYQLFDALRYVEDVNRRKIGQAALGRVYQQAPDNFFVLRSEERRRGKVCRSRWSPDL